VSGRGIAIGWCVCLWATVAAAAPRVRIAIDYETAERTLALLEDPAVTRESVEELIALPGTRGLIEHAAGMDRRRTKEAFVTSLLAVARKKPPPMDDGFGLAGVLERRDQVRGLLAAIRADPAGFTAAVSGRLAAYMPVSVSLDTKVYLVVGGGSDGFTMPGTTFFLALDQFRGEMAGVRLMTTHELFHLAQEAMATPAKKARPAATSTLRGLLAAVVDEGTASLVADPLRVKEGAAGPWMQWYAGKYRRNLDHLELNFALVDTLLHRAATDPRADGDALYRLGFSGSLDSLAYYVGYRMAQVIEQRRGRAYLVDLIAGDPAAFFREYAAVAPSRAPRFSAAVTKIIADLPAAR
jgi:hypothetical protein